MRARILWTLSLMGALGCTMTAPQTRADFVDTITGGHAMTQTRSYTASRGFDAVVSTLRSRSDDCLNVSVTQRRQSGYAVSTFTITYHPTFQRVDDRRAELTIQHVATPRTFGPEMPEGGFYTVAVDIERVSAKQTQLTMYGPSMGWGETFTAFERWSDGKSADCPLT